MVVLARSLDEWRDYLLPELAARVQVNAALRAMYDGNHPLPTAPNRSSDKYTRLARMSITNMCGLIVDAPTSKLTPKGVRLSEDGDEDLDLWRQVWTRNRLNARCRVAHEEALKVGRAFVLVWPTDDGGVSVTVEDADQMIVAYAPGSVYERVAALKWYYEAGYDYVTVWDAQSALSWRRERSTYASLATSSGDWEVDPDLPGGTNDLGAVPVVEFVCKPDAKGDPKLELNEGVLQLQARINKTMFDIVVAGEDGAYPQRVMIGIDVPDTLTQGPNRVWALDSADSDNPGTGQITQFPAYDTSGLLNFAEASIRELGWISRTSAIFMLGGASNVGADMIRALDDGHRAKVVAHQIVFGEAWEETFALALRALGRETSGPIEIDWESPEFSTPAEKADAAIKLRQAGYSFKAIARYMGASPAEVKRLIAERTEDGADEQNDTAARVLQQVYLAVQAGVITAAEAREIANRSGAGLVGPPPERRSAPALAGATP